jgi:DNA-binding transcriptional MerR regulator
MIETPTADRHFVSIGVAAERAGCSPQAVRNMELRGEVPPAARVEGLGRRLYTMADVERIRQVRAARKSGTRLAQAT